MGLTIHKRLAILGCAFAAQAAAQTLQQSIDAGRTVYTNNCAACHGADGNGAPTRGVKALNGSAVVLAQPWAQLRVLLDGVPGTAMQQWSGMSDANLAAVITYTKNAWTNATGQNVLAADVAAARIKPPQPVPAVWPAPIGTGTALQVATIVRDATDADPSKTPKCVAWWYAPDQAAPGGWRPHYVWTEKPWYALCKAAIPVGLTAANLASIWTTAGPRSLVDAGESWAAAIWWQDHGKPKMPPAPGYVVQPYSTALYRATFPVLAGKRSTTSNGRVLVLTAGKPTPLDCALRVVEGAALYCGVPGLASTVAPAKAAP